MSCEHSVDFVSDAARKVIEVAVYVILCSAVSYFGMAANVINMAVFLKDGVNTSVNISLFLLSLSDFCSLLTLAWFSLCMNPLLLDTNALPLDNVQYLTGAWPRGSFANTTSWITTYITADRCFCIAMPMKVKDIITPRKTTVIIIGIYMVMIISLVPEFSSAYLAWTFVTGKNVTFLSLEFRENRKSVEGVSFFLTTVLGIVSFVCLITFTTILVVKLHQQMNWRADANPNTHQLKMVSKRERKIVKMVILIATILIVCYTPALALSAYTFFDVNFSVTGCYVNLFFATWSFGFLFEAVNSSVNIFLYYNMSSKYKARLNAVVC
ncbi:unnamed protein product, partial [Lymnaea stagnalis]